MRGTVRTAVRDARCTKCARRVWNAVCRAVSGAVRVMRQRCAQRHSGCCLHCCLGDAWGNVSKSFWGA
eukprot:1999291-Lingulodinium_polyedra.AAC.1